MAVLVALFHRERTGEGQQVETDLFSAAIDMQMEPATYYLNGAELSRSEAGVPDLWHWGPYGLYRTLDGYLALSLTNLAVLGQLIGAPELGEARFADVRGAFERRDEIYRLVSRVMVKRTTRDWLGLLEPCDIWCAQVRDYQEVFADPQVRENQMVIEVDHPRLGPIRFTGMPMRFGATPGSLRLPPPELGQHTDLVLEELGYGRAEIEVLRTEGVV